MVDLQTDILNTLNHNGHDEVKISNHNPSDESNFNPFYGFLDY